MVAMVCLVSIATGSILYDSEAHIVVKVAPAVMSSKAVVYIDNNRNFDIINDVKGFKIDRYGSK